MVIARRYLHAAITDFQPCARAAWQQLSYFDRTGVFLDWPPAVRRFSAVTSDELEDVQRAAIFFVGITRAVWRRTSTPTERNLARQELAQRLQMGDEDFALGGRGMRGYDDEDDGSVSRLAAAIDGAAADAEGAGSASGSGDARRAGAARGGGDVLEDDEGDGGEQHGDEEQGEDDGREFGYGVDDDDDGWDGDM
jgi:hypothetical protein